MSASCCIVKPMSSKPLIKQCLRNSSTSNGIFSPFDRMTTWFGKSISSSCLALASAMSVFTVASSRTMGNMAFLKQLLKKMSAKAVEMMHRMPKSLIAHGACSREDPQPKLLPATKMEALRYGSLFNTKSGRSTPCSS